MAGDIVLKVTAYITRSHQGKQELLVFREQGFEHLGFQVPGGTVERNEGLIEALKREVREEAGIKNLNNIKLLGEFSYYSKPLERNVTRYYYQMKATCPDQFSHIVESDDEDNGWIYNYFWCDIKDIQALYGYLGIHLDKIR
jgi:8-oxo-dGTP pyrophosphatase MutT (NUDIX family)